MKQANSVIIIGAGPIGLAAAAQLLARGQKPWVLEKGPQVGSAVMAWGHVRVFTPWRNVVDSAVAALLARQGWALENPDELPLGREIVSQYLMPAAETPELKPLIRYQTEVIAVSKAGHSKHTSGDRDQAPFSVQYRDENGNVEVVLADAVIDASGTWSTPNPIGLDGLPVPGERDNPQAITYGIPDVLGAERRFYEGRRTLVLGSGHSAMNAVLDLLTLKKDNPKTFVYWGLRKAGLEVAEGGALDKALPARGELGSQAAQACDDGSIALLPSLKVNGIERQSEALKVTFDQGADLKSVVVDRILVSTGFRPNLDITRELRLNLDPVVEAPSALAPLIDPNVHSCGSVPLHGVVELSHVDRNFYIVGMKSYGRAPTFLMMTGYEQVRSIAAEIAGDFESARTVTPILSSTQEACPPVCS